MATAIARPPDPNAIAINFGESSGIGDGVTVVAHLRPRVNLLARLALACPKVPVVEDEGPKPAAANTSAYASRYIPAVVGSAPATRRLHTGDWVRVDGEHGTVEVVRWAGSQAQ